MNTATRLQRAVARIDLDAIAANCKRLRRELAGGAELCAVVKADGYGHGMVQSARAAIAGGATRLAVVTVDEAAELAAANFEVPVLVMSPVLPDDLDAAIATGAELTAWSERAVEEMAAAAGRAGATVKLHVKLDTGMGRFGAKQEAEAMLPLTLAERSDNIEPVAVWTHFATADEPDSVFFGDQLKRFTQFVADAREQFPNLKAHAANSAATLREPRSHFDFVRCGIAIYGLDPFHEDAAKRELKPALSLHSYVAAMRRFEAGESTGYGRRFFTDLPSDIATIPIGYGDGWRRQLSNKAEVLINGRRFRQVGTVSMDSITVDLATESGVAETDAVTLIGSDGSESISAETVAGWAETINYEITCGLTRRTVREYTGDLAAA